MGSFIVIMPLEGNKKPTNRHTITLRHTQTGHSDGDKFNQRDEIATHYQLQLQLQLRNYYYHPDKLITSTNGPLFLYFDQSYHFHFHFLALGLFFIFGGMRYLHWSRRPRMV